MPINLKKNWILLIIVQKKIQMYKKNYLKHILIKNWKKQNFTKKLIKKKKNKILKMH